MKHVTFAEYQAAKMEIIGGVEYKETSTLEGDTIRKVYATKENGVFYEVNDGGRIEFWSDKHPQSQIYDERPTTPEKKEEVPHYGELLAEKIRATIDSANLSEFEKFVLDRGYLFNTEEALKAGYDRVWKSSHGILVSQEEFLAEVNLTREHPNAAGTYKALVKLVEEKKLAVSSVLGYAAYHWCMNRPEAVVAYQTGRERWEVNTCDTEISRERAVIEVNSEWGFEASRVRIVETPYYDATDWNWIRFDCAGMSWLMCNGQLHPVWE